MIKKFQRLLYLSAGLLLIMAMALVEMPHSAQAAQITLRSLTLEAGASAGGSDPGGVVNHYFQFTIPSTTAVQSVQLLYCTTAALTCNPPLGLVTAAATLGTTSAGLAGFTLNNATADAPYLTSATATNISGAQSVILDSVTNPSATNTTFYVRISTFTTSNATGTAVDTGNVAASTATPIVLSGTMPESLVFCTGGTVSETSGVPDCTTATSGAVSFTTLFSPTATATATSQMAASTNAGSGYVITINGLTLQSGSNSISAMSPATTSVLGTSQFGTNLVVNTTPAIGTALTPASDGTNYRGQPLVGYNTANTFDFTTGNSVANSGDTVLGGTDAQIYTNSYMVNVPGNQPAGTYTTTITYICTPTY